MQFNSNQLQLYVDYEKVRLSGEFNMFDRRAAEAAGLTKEEHLFVISHYSELREQYEHSNEPVQLAET